MRIHVPVPLRWSDLDAYNHVNNVAVLRLLEEVRVQAFWSAGDDAVADPLPTAVLDAQPGAPVISLIAHLESEYLAPIPYSRQPLDGEVWIGRLGGSSVLVCYEIHSPAGALPRTLYVRAETTLVLVDAASGRPRRIGEAARAAWQPYLEDPVAFSRRR